MSMSACAEPLFSEFILVSHQARASKTPNRTQMKYIATISLTITKRLVKTTVCDDER